MKPTLLIVDDDEAIRTQMKWSLSEDYEVYFAQDRQEAVDAFEANSPAVTLLDLGLPPSPNECDEGLAVLSDLLAIDNTAKVIIISGQSASSVSRRSSISTSAKRSARWISRPPPSSPAPVSWC